MAVWWLLAGLAWAEPGQALVLIYNSLDDHSVQIQLELMTQLKSLRGAGHFKAQPALSEQFISLDLNVPTYAGLPKQWGMPPVAVPYLALVSLVKGKPKKYLWGLHVDTASQALAALDGKLGLASPGPDPGAQPRGWVSWTSPDGSFTLSLPRAPEPIDSGDSQLWAAGAPGQGAYMFGYLARPGMSASLREYADQYLSDTDTTQLTCQSTQVSGYEALDIRGSRPTGAVRTVLVLCPPLQRIYVLAAFGEELEGRFFTSLVIQGR